MIELLPVFEYLGKWALGKAESEAKSQVEAWFTQKDFSDQVNDTISAWSKTVPYTVFVGKAAKLDLRHAKLSATQNKVVNILKQDGIPEEYLWLQLLREHRARVGPLVEPKGESFYTISDENAEEHVKDLAQRLFNLCAQQEKNFRIRMVRGQFTLEAYGQKILDRLTQLESLQSQTDNDQEKQLIKKQLNDLQVKYDNLEKSYQEQIRYLQSQINELQGFRSLVSEDVFAEAQLALTQGDESKAKAIYTQVSQAVKMAEKAGAKAEYNLGEMARNAIDYQTAFDHYKDAVRRDPNHSEYLLALGRLAFIIARYDLAIDTYDKALSIQLEDAGDADSAVLWNELGLAWDRKGQTDKAIEYFEKALNSDLKTYGPEHPSVAICWNNLGLAWERKGQYDKAIEYFEKALNSDLQTYGPEHPSVAIRWNNLGSAWNSKGQYDKAIEYYEKALESELKIYGPIHPHVAAFWNNLGMAWSSKGQYDKAIDYYEKALKVRIKSLGDDHPDVATSWNTLGLAWTHKGQYDKAIGYYEKALISDLKTYGPEHPDVALEWYSLAAVWFSKGDYGKSVEYLEKTVSVYKKNPGADHPDTLKAISWLKKAKDKLMVSVE